VLLKSCDKAICHNLLVVLAEHDVKRDEVVFQRIQSPSDGEPPVCGGAKVRLILEFSTVLKQDARPLYRTGTGAHTHLFTMPFFRWRTVSCILRRLHLAVPSPAVHRRCPKKL
jgi:hypothetical protein